MNLSLLKFYSNLLFKLKLLIEKCWLMLIFIIVKNLRKLNFNFVDVYVFTHTNNVFFLFCFFNDIKNKYLSNDIKFIKKKKKHF